MPAPLTAAGESAVADIAVRYRLSDGAVRTLLDAVVRGGGAMAQFSHPELGGNGQWMRGGMAMVGDMFNPGLQATVSGVCSELSSLLASGGVLVRPSDTGVAGGGLGGFGGQAWWPEGLGRPSSSGGQNDASYAYFPGPRRLAIRRSGAITLYDTLDHAFSGVQQQQGGRGSLEFSSQHGTFTVDTLPVVSGSAPTPTAPERAADTPSAQSWPAAPPSKAVAQPPVPPVASVAAVGPPAVSAPPAGQPASAPPPAPSGIVTSAAEIGAAIETLASLRDKGFVTEAEFAAKKAELVFRL